MGILTRKGLKICNIKINYLNGSFIRYESAFHDGKDVPYEISKWTKRPKNCGALAVFDTIEHAIDFLSNKLLSLRTHEKVLFECKYKKSKCKRLYCERLTLPEYTETHIKELPKDEIPKGTMFADKVKLIKKIE